MSGKHTARSPCKARLDKAGTRLYLLCNIQVAVITMNRFSASCFVLAFVLLALLRVLPMLSAPLAAASPAVPSALATDGDPETDTLSAAAAQPATPWVSMPAGARPAFMGIHGGTMPVSLMVSDDGSALLTFVGRTGNDFLEILRRSDLPVPSLLNATARGMAGDKAESSLFAGSGTDSMPVLVSGDPFAPPAVNALQPFGLSEKPLSIEGEVLRPLRLSPEKRFRLYFEPQHLQPRAARP